MEISLKCAAFKFAGSNKQNKKRKRNRCRKSISDEVPLKAYGCSLYVCRRTRQHLYIYLTYYDYHQCKACFETLGFLLQNHHNTLATFYNTYFTRGLVSSQARDQLKRLRVPWMILDQTAIYLFWLLYRLEV